MSMLRTILRNLMSGPVTIKYPNVPADIPRGNRGRLDWDMEKCILCGLCQKRCPTLAVVMDKNVGTISLQVHRCISCGVCAEICPKSAISIGREYSAPSHTKELRVYQKDMSREKEKEVTAPLDEENRSEAPV